MKPLQPSGFNPRYTAVAPDWRPGRQRFGLALAALIAALIGLLLASLVLAGQTIPSRTGTGPDILHLLRMSTLQAGTSTLLSIGVGLLLAWTLDRLRFPGRALTIGLISSALVLPSLVIVSGVLAMLGRNGLVNTLLAAFGLSTGSAVFGFWGIVIAHVLLNGAFAGRLFLDRLAAIPGAQLRLGRSLSLSPLQRLRILDLPALLPSVPPIAATIFLLCFTSFPIVLLLGGGPANQTFEVAIFEAVRLDFDLPAAVRLALIQLGVCALIIVPATALTPAPIAYERNGRTAWPSPRPLALVQALILLCLLTAWISPLLAVLVRGTPAALSGLAVNPAFWNAAWTSAWIGAASTALTLALAIILGMGRAALDYHPTLRLLIAMPVFAYHAVPAVVLGLGFFLLARQTGLSTALAAPIVLVIANALLALPFAMAALGPALTAIAGERGKLIRSLGLDGWTQWRRIEWPLIAPALGYAAAVAFTFSLGDLGVIALFGTQDFSTLPWMMYRAFGAYRTADAEAIAAVLLVVSVLAFTSIPRIMERIARART